MSNIHTVGGRELAARVQARKEAEFAAEQPVGEYPHLPTVARAYKSVDELAAENRDLRAAREQLQRDNVALQAKLEDARFEVDSVTTLLKASGHHVAALSDNLCSYQAERDELRDQLEEFADYRELRVRVDELEQERDELRDAKGWLDGMVTRLAAERDTAKAQASVKR